MGCLKWLIKNVIVVLMVKCAMTTRMKTEKHIISVISADLRRYHNDRKQQKEIIKKLDDIKLLIRGNKPKIQTPEEEEE